MIRFYSFFFIVIAFISIGCQTTPAEQTAEASVQTATPANNIENIIERFKNPSKDYIIAISHRGD